MDTGRKTITPELRKMGEIASRLDDIEETLAECQDATRTKLEEVRTVLDAATEAIDDAVEKVTPIPSKPGDEDVVGPGQHASGATSLRTTARDDTE